MNILFYSVYEPSPLSGGVEHVTLRVAEGLTMKYGYRCYSLYKRNAGCVIKDQFVEKVQIPSHGSKSFITEYCKKNSIDEVVVQGIPAMVSVFRETGAFILYVHHADPLFEITTFNVDYLLYILKNKKYNTIREKILCIEQLVLFPLYKLYIEYKHKQQFKRINKDSDKIALISKSSIKSYIRLSRIKCIDKLCYINNPLSFEYFATEEDVRHKKKQVLIVCRMEEFSKKITKALQIWDKVNKDQRSKGWDLVIIGDGKDFDTYKEIVKKKGIAGIKFIGKTNPYKYYLESSIFFMTSISEAWGITLTEAMQLGCVPIAFDSYSSVRDIINTGDAGVLIPYGNIVDYAEAALNLMNDEKLRFRMAMKSVESSRRFDLETICKKWNEVIRGERNLES